MSEQNIPSVEWVKEKLIACRVHLGLAESRVSPEPSLATAEKVQAYLALLLSWGERMDLVSPAPPEEQFRRHFLDCYAADLVLRESLDGDFPAAAGVVDVGSGAGFPGMLIGILHPDIQVCLVESRQKRCQFLNEVRRQLELENVKVFQSRFREIYPQLPDPISIVISRALGDYPQFVNTARELLLRNKKGLVTAMVGPSFSNPIKGTEESFRFLRYSISPESHTLSVAIWRVP